jgi:hypothetical protein
MVRWDDAVEAAHRLRNQCFDAAGARYLDTLTQRDRQAAEPWALVLYAVASETSQAPSAVTATQLRYRADASDEDFSAWLLARLQAAGHIVHAPRKPPTSSGMSFLSEEQAHDADLFSAITILQTVNYASSDRADDPVALRWRMLSPVYVETIPTTEGITVGSQPSSSLWSTRTEMIGMLDPLLILQRGGWPIGTRVRTTGVPHYISPTGALPAEIKVSGDRAVIHAPVWTLDHDRHVLTDGPPLGYELAYRDLETGGPSHHHRGGPVSPDHLLFDTGAWPDGHAPVPYRPSPAAPTAPPPAAPPQRDMDSSPAPLRRAMAAEDHARQGALQRLWELRDRELTQVGDTTPLRLAERMVAGAVPAPAPPQPYRHLRDLEQFSPGKARSELLDWLPHVVHWWTTAKQRACLDGFHADTTITEARAFLHDEGFVEALDVHGNATSDTPSGDVQLLLFNADQGMLAELWAPSFRELPPHIEHIRIVYQVEAIDPEMLIVSGTRHFEAGGIQTGDLTEKIQLAGAGSLRVQLAALRAFARPVLPWRTHPRIYLGHDGTPPTEVRRILQSLPQHIHDTLGPHLLPPE